MVDDSANLSSLMETLSHQNQELVTKNNDLNTLVNELELAIEVNEQLDASQRLEIDTLRQSKQTILFLLFFLERKMIRSQLSYSPHRRQRSLFKEPLLSLSPTLRNCASMCFNDV